MGLPECHQPLQRISQAGLLPGQSSTTLFSSIGRRGGRDTIMFCLLHWTLERLSWEFCCSLLCRTRARTWSGGDRSPITARWLPALQHPGLWFKVVLFSHENGVCYMQFWLVNSFGPLDCCKSLIDNTKCYSNLRLSGLPLFYATYYSWVWSVLPASSFSSLIHNIEVQENGL